MQLLTSVFRIASWLAFAMAAFVLAAASIWYVTGGRLMVVQTSSMRPQFSPSDVVLLRPMVADQAQRGQVISYHSFSKPREIISHRVVAIQPNGAIITKGDNRPDNDLPVPAPAVIGKVVAVAPGMGNLMRWLKSGYGLTLLYVAASCLLSINIGRFLAKSGQAYELHGR